MGVAWVFIIGTTYQSHQFEHFASWKLWILKAYSYSYVCIMSTFTMREIECCFAVDFTHYFNTPSEVVDIESL